MPLTRDRHVPTAAAETRPPSQAVAEPALPRRAVAFNGTFLSKPARGLGRMASELVLALDGLLAGAGARVEVLCRRGARRLELGAIAQRPAGVLDVDAWEQLELPGLARGRLLVNLCNMAPLMSRGGIAAIHDAHVFLMPGSHTPSYAAWYRFALPKVAARAARLFTVSEFSRQTLVETGVAPEHKLSVIPNGSDHLQRIRPDPSIIWRLGLQGRPFVVALANAQSHKNIGVLLEGFRSTAAAPFTLVLVGPHTAEHFLAKGHQIPDRTVFAGVVNDAELKALYEAAVCMATPSLLEGFGLCAAEAMSLGCPVVASPRAALPEVCGEAALYADPHDPDAWTGHIRRLAENGEARAGAIERGLQRAARMRWSDSARALLTLIASI
jgi:glycosyltransferase involved in cell wall biosynthesis